MSVWTWNWTHVPSHAKVVATITGQRKVRAQIRLTTCRPALVCMRKCVHLTFKPSVTTKSVRMCNRTEVKMIATKGGRRQRCSRVSSVQMWVWKDTRIGTCLETHTQQADTKPHTHRFHFCLVWQHSWNTSAPRLKFIYRSGHTHTRTQV